MTPSRYAALVRVIAKTSEMLMDSNGADRRIGRAVDEALRDGVAKEMGCGVLGVMDAELKCGRLDISPDGTKASYCFDIAAYQSPKKKCRD